MLNDILSMVGAWLVLGAYIGNLFHFLDRDGVTYAALNLVGSGLLGYVAYQSSPVGLILIEVAWALISVVALIKAIRSLKPALPLNSTGKRKSRKRRPSHRKA